MRAMSRRTRRQVIYGCIAWLPILFIVFSVLYVDAWLNTETRSNDYQLADLSGKIRSLQESINGVRAEEARFEAVKLLTMRASEIGLVEPQPQQIQIVQYLPSQRQIVADDVPMALARLEKSKARMQGKGPGTEEAINAPAAEIEPAGEPEHAPEMNPVEPAPVAAPSAPETPASLAATPVESAAAPEIVAGPPSLDIPQEPVDEPLDGLDSSVNKLLAEL